MSGCRIVLATFGSLGDLHPYLAIARGLNARGHHAILATSELYRARVEAEGVRFAAVRPDIDVLLDRETGGMARYMDRVRGPERVVRELFIPFLEQTYADTLAAAEGADTLVSHPLTFTVPMVAEQLRIRWVSSVLAPLSFFSAFDPPVPPGRPWIEGLRAWGPHPARLVFAIAALATEPWVRPVAALRARLGLPRTAHPLFAGQHSPECSLGLFSRSLALPQRDWPAHTTLTGFPFLDDPRSDPLPEGLAAFLDAGDPPLVFTLGSSAVHDAREFYAESLAHAAALGRRALLLIGRDAGNSAPTPLPRSAFAVDYAPYSIVFPRAAAIVHQGGIGTTAEAMRSGRPMLVLPFSHDQFDHAARVRRLGIGNWCERADYAGAPGRRALSSLLDDADLHRRAAETGTNVRAEDGIGVACDAIVAASTA